MSMIIKAVTQGSPVSLVSSAATAYFSSVLNWPAGLKNTPVSVRGRGSIVIPAGFVGSVNAGLLGFDGSSYKGIIGSSTSVSGPGALPFAFDASLYADPFLGLLIDINCNPGKAKFPLPTLAASGALVGDQSNSFPYAVSFGAGVWNFDTTPVPLYVSLGLAVTSGAIPQVTATLTQFELEY